LIVTCILVVSGCGRSPSVSFTAKINGGQIEFRFGYHNVNGLLSMMVWEKESRAKLWDIDLDYYFRPLLKYGEVPLNFTTFNNAPERSARQKFPPDSSPPQAIPVGKEMLVQIRYQYDSFISACSSEKFFSFRINPDGTITNFGEVSDLSVIKFPDTPNQVSKPKDSNSLPDH
jgi:hypothetical protein